MRRSLSILFLGLAYAFVLVPDLVHVPAFFGHYQRHKAQSPDMDLGDFLVLHYADKEHEANGDADHGQLPFHHHHTATDAQPPMVLLALLAMSVSDALPPLLPEVQVEEDLLPGHRYGLFQPPRC